MKTEKVTVTVPSIFGYEEVVVEAVGTIARVRKFPFEKVSKEKGDDLDFKKERVTNITHKVLHSAHF